MTSAKTAASFSAAGGSWVVSDAGGISLVLVTESVESTQKEGTIQRTRGGGFSMGESVWKEMIAVPHGAVAPQSMYRNQGCEECAAVSSTEDEQHEAAEQ